MFKDKVVLITGASRGIGRAAAIEFGKEHASVIVNYRSDKKSADQVVNEIKKQLQKAVVSLKFFGGP